MMNINSKMFRKIKDRDYRRRFIFGQIKTGIPFQLRTLRNAREMTQKDLGEAAKIPQTVVSRIENGTGENLSIKTLLKLADAFDVALVIRFEPIDKLVDWVDNLSPEAMSPEPSEKILAEAERKALAQGATTARQRGPRAVAADGLRVHTTDNPKASQLRLGFMRPGLSLILGTQHELGNFDTGKESLGMVTVSDTVKAAVAAGGK